MGSLAWQKYSPAHCQARDHQVQSWHLTSKYVSFIAFRLPQGKGLSVPGQTNEQEEDKEVSTNPQEEVEDDTDSENENPVEEDDDDDSLTFMRAVTTRSGRAVRVKFFSVGS